MSATLSLCMIVRDEEAVLGRCLDSVRGLCDEIIVVDTGSHDATREIARRYTERVYSFDWIDDFAAARNASFAYAVGDYLMWLDADDVLDEESVRRIAAYKKRNFDGKRMLACRYHVGFDENGDVSFWYYRERIMARAAQPVWIGFVHECVPWSADTALTEIAVQHRKPEGAHSERNLGILRKRSAQVLQDPRLHYYYARELKDCGYATLAEREFLQCLEAGGLSDADCAQACRELAQLARAAGDRQRDLDYQMRALLYGVPSAELSCEIGGRFVERNRYREAAYWYHQALLAPRDPYQFTLEEAHAFMPYVMLTVCYDRLGERNLALQYHRLAQKIKPNNKYVIYNQKYFDSMSHITDNFIQ